MKQLIRQDAKTRISKFLSGEKVLLNSEEEKILARWEHASELLIKKEKSWVEIRDSLAFQFVVSKYTAENDIINAQEVFGTTRKINKRFLLHLHLDRMDRDIERIRAGLFFYKDNKGKVTEKTPNAKEIAALARLAEAYTYTVNSIPDDIDRSKLPPPIMMFRLPEGISMNLPMTIEEAMRQADQFIEFEDLTNGTNDIQPNGSANPGEGTTDPAHDDPADQTE